MYRANRMTCPSRRARVVGARADLAHSIAVSVQTWSLPAASENAAKLCNKLPSEWSANPIARRTAMLAVVQDVTDRKRLELELQSSQRLEAVGHLAAGIAHEINTPIQFVGDNLHFIRDAFTNHQAAWEEFGRQLNQAVLAGEAPQSVLDSWERTERAAGGEYPTTEEIGR